MKRNNYVYIAAYFIGVILVVGNYNHMAAKEPVYILKQPTYFPQGQPEKIKVDNKSETQYYFMSILNEYSPELFEKIRNIAIIDDKDEIALLWSIQEELNGKFLHWDQMKEQQKEFLEKVYGCLWQRLLEMRDQDPKILETYKSLLDEDGNDLPAALYAMRRTPYFDPFNENIKKEFILLFKKTKNAATISNCCRIIITSPELQNNPQYWDLFQDKMKMLQSETLTEHTAMGIILLKNAIAYKGAKEAEEKQLTEGIDISNIRQQSISILIPQIT